MLPFNYTCGVTPGKVKGVDIEACVWVFQFPLYVPTQRLTVLRTKLSSKHIQLNLTMLTGSSSSSSSSFLMPASGLVTLTQWELHQILPALKACGLISMWRTLVEFVKTQRVWWLCFWVPAFDFPVEVSHVMLLTRCLRAVGHMSHIQPARKQYIFPDRSLSAFL